MGDTPFSAPVSLSCRMAHLSGLVSRNCFPLDTVIQLVASTFLECPTVVLFNISRWSSNLEKPTMHCKNHLKVDCLRSLLLSKMQVSELRMVRCSRCFYTRTFQSWKKRWLRMSCDFHLDLRLSSSFASLAHLSLFEFFCIFVNFFNLFAFVRLGGSSCSAWLRLGFSAVQLWFIEQASAWWVTRKPSAQRSCKKRKSKGGASTFELDPMVQGLKRTYCKSQAIQAQLHFDRKLMFHVAATRRHLVLAEPQRSWRHLGLFASKHLEKGCDCSQSRRRLHCLKTRALGWVSQKEFGWTFLDRFFTRTICWKHPSKMSAVMVGQTTPPNVHPRNKAFLRAS